LSKCQCLKHRLIKVRREEIDRATAKSGDITGFPVMYCDCDGQRLIYPKPEKGIRVEFVDEGFDGVFGYFYLCENPDDCLEAYHGDPARLSLP
jgi:hypothetical protein